jgi:hypothetical protein
MNRPSFYYPLDETIFPSNRLNPPNPGSETIHNKASHHDSLFLFDANSQE